MRNWPDIAYLLRGNKKQQAAYHALHNVGILKQLLAFDPILVGTIPIDIDIDTSDLDIILCAQDFQELAQIVRKHYQHHTDFYERFSQESYVANFFAHGFEFELFAQDKPTIQQNAYRHMLIEYRILKFASDTIRQAIRQLKQDGLKTEPAFAQYFSLEGDPYEALLELEKLDDETLQAQLNL